MSGNIPLLYKLYWVGLIAMVVLMVSYFFFLHQREKHRLIKPLTLLFIFLALSLYLMEQGQILSGYFDSAAKVFVPGYHEVNEIGFLRFFYKLTLGIALWAFGFITYLDRLKNKKSSTLRGESK
ncbi:MAG: hypothetical protein AB1611_19900 [bacterium]